MKSKLLLIFLSLFISINVMAGVGGPKPILVPSKFNKLYVPEGFDSNDNVQIVAEGYSPNNCYRYAFTKVEVDHRTRKISLASSSFKYGGDCLDVTIPYDRVLDLGILSEGTYSVIQTYDNKIIGEIHIGATEKLEADDYLYAPITQAYFKVGRCSNKVLLTGNFPLSCMKLKEVRTNVQPEVFVLQPIVELDKSVACKEGQFPFEKSVKADGLESKKRYLLHVRSVNGKAINSLVDVPKKNGESSPERCN